jgi:hypothetical protein
MVNGVHIHDFCDFAEYREVAKTIGFTKSVKFVRMAEEMGVIPFPACACGTFFGHFSPGRTPRSLGIQKT